ncbi:hypothetical protein F5X68DRAFT_8828 [Plectosphaerella plurivora]|uniref:Uncharacterized protein n=1 Tax=Plectosphaerella plurivora TaxID=936078 RepID=A0A9P9AAW7_9PEZI|nr:hypothetical protein F5X68DRAFT_8828 [Plectosphaerella plurivora]
MQAKAHEVDVHAKDTNSLRVGKSAPFLRDYIVLWTRVSKTRRRSRSSAPGRRPGPSPTAGDVQPSMELVLTYCRPASTGPSFPKRMLGRIVGWESQNDGHGPHGSAGTLCGQSPRPDVDHLLWNASQRDHMLAVAPKTFKKGKNIAGWVNHAGCIRGLDITSSPTCHWITPISLRSPPTTAAWHTKRASGRLINSNHVQLWLPL